MVKIYLGFLNLFNLIDYDSGEERVLYLMVLLFHNLMRNFPFSILCPIPRPEAENSGVRQLPLFGGVLSSILNF